MKKAERIQAYFMRVNEGTGQPYQGYRGEIRNTLKAFQRYVSFGESCMNMETRTFSSGLVLICSEYGKVLHYPVNRALTDAEGRILDVIHGNAVVVRYADDAFVGILSSDVQEIRRFLIPVTLAGGRNVRFLPDERLPEYREGYPDAGADG